MRKHLTVLATASALLASTFALQPAHAATDGSDLIINEVYARGGSANQPYKHKYIELYNPTGEAIDLADYGLSYSSDTNAGLGNVCDLTGGELGAGEFYVVTVGSNGTTGEDVVGDQNCTNINPSGTDGAMTLVTGGSTTVDLVGWGTAARYEGSGRAAYPGRNSTPGSITRTNAVDTDDNAADFTFVEVPTPGWDDSIDGSTEPTDPDPTDPPVDPDPDPTDPPVDPEPEYTAIADIQGTGSATPLAGQTITTIGVVTAAYPTGGFNGFYLQTPGTGGTAKVAGDASDGIFVYTGAAPAVEVGECYVVTGTAGEYNGLTQLSNPVLEPAAECDDVVATELSSFPATDAEKEVYEGMLVLPTDTYTITNNYALNQYGQIGLAYGDEPLFQATDVVRPGDEAIAYEAANLRKEITLDDGSSWNYMNNNTAKNTPLPYLSDETPMRTGSQVTFAEPVILDYRFQWNYQPTSQVVGAEQTFLTTENDRPATAPEVGGDVQLASFNVLNYFDDLGIDEEGCRYYADMYGEPVAANNCQVRGAYTESAFADQEAKIVTAINKLDADVVGLQEIQNSAGVSYLPGQDRDKALATLVAALNEAGGNWAYVPSPTVVPTSEDVIRTAFIYNPDTVELVGPSYILVDDAFANARYPLAQEFQVIDSSTTFVAINNHFKSKGSGEDDGTGQGNANPSRIEQATELSEWANTFEEFADKPVFLMGDFNAYSMEDPIRIIEEAGYTNLTRGGVTDEATYQFSGRLGSLDHILANEAALELVTGAAVWNINGDESIAFQYSRRNYNIVDFHSNDEYASSDHDAVVVGIEAAEAVAPVITPYATLSCYSFGFTVTGDVPEGAKLRITWMRDGQEQSTTVSPDNWWSGDQWGWSDARAQLIAADGTVLAETEVINPDCVLPEVVPYTTLDCDSFGFVVTGDVPEGAKLHITWTREGQAQHTVVDTVNWWSGNGQFGWADAQAKLIDAKGKVLASTDVINPTMCTDLSDGAIHIGPNYVEVATTDLPADAEITVTVTYRNGRTAVYTAKAGDADPFHQKVPGYASVEVEVRQGNNLIGHGSAAR